MSFQCKYNAPPRDQYFTDIFNSSQNNAFVVIINKSNIKLVIKYGTFSLVFLALFLLKYQLIKIRWYFKRNKDRNTRENMPYLITRLIFAIYRPWVMSWFDQMKGFFEYLSTNLTDFVGLFVCLFVCWLENKAITRKWKFRTFQYFAFR